jgi:hypothetical protein
MPDNQLFVWGQPLEVDDQVYCCGFGEVHHMIEYIYRFDIGLGCYCLISRTPNGSRLFETESQGLEIRVCMSGDFVAYAEPNVQRLEVYRSRL